MMKLKQSQKGSSIVSYLTMITIVVMAIVGMRVYMMRWGHSMIRYVSDYLGEQKEAEQDFGDNGARLVSSDATVSSDNVKYFNESAGVRRYEYNERQETSSNQLLDLGPSRQR